VVPRNDKEKVAPRNDTSSARRRESRVAGRSDLRITGFSQ
jgi:hypothetical protein